MNTMIKYVVGCYFLIGLLVAPFMRSNDLMAYRGFDKPLSVGITLMSTVYWPSYLFSIEPELNGSDSDEFTQSIAEILKFREDKAFTGSKKSKTFQNFALVYDALGACVAAEGAAINMSDTDLIKNFFNKGSDDVDIMAIRMNVMKKFDGHDFSDIYHEGQKCHKIYSQKPKSEKMLKTANPIIIAPISELDQKSVPKKITNSSEEFNDFDVGYGLKWGEVLNNPQAYVLKCTEISIDMAKQQGGYSDEEAKQWLGESCTNEFRKLKKCITGESSSSAKKCIAEYEE